MKNKFLLPVILLITILMTSTAYANIDIGNENKYGMPVTFTGLGDYRGEITVDGIYVYKQMNKNVEEYIFTLLYSKGELAIEKYSKNKLVKTSFFNPPDGDIFMITPQKTPDRIVSDDKKVQYRIEADKLKQTSTVSIFLYDVLHDNYDENITCSFKTKLISFDRIPSVNELTKGYTVSSETIDGTLPEGPSAWAVKDIGELKLSGIFLDAAFDSYQKSITRLRFVYLMVELYEELTHSTVATDGSVAFLDTKDPYALKAAQIGITNGIGNNLFGPNDELSREQMATFVIRTLKLANVKLDHEGDPAVFDDDSNISEWAREPVYTSRYFNIIGGTGANTFSPKGPATNEQALVIIRRLLDRFGGLKWYYEEDGSRFYTRFAGKLYKVDLGKDIIMNENGKDNDLFCMSLEDIETLLDLAHLKEYQLVYEPTRNPNYTGTVKVPEFNYIDQIASNIYSGVDRVGEKAVITFTSGFNSEKVTVSVTTVDRLGSASYNGFSKINYYDMAQKSCRMYALPVKDIFKTLGISYTLEYNKTWDIYIIEFNDVE